MAVQMLHVRLLYAHGPRAGDPAPWSVGGAEKTEWGAWGFCRDNLTQWDIYFRGYLCSSAGTRYAQQGASVRWR